MHLLTPNKKAWASSSPLSSFSPLCNADFFFLTPDHSLTSGSIPVTTGHVLCSSCHCSSLPPLSTFFPSSPLTLQSFAQHLKSWDRADHARDRCHDLTAQTIELGFGMAFFITINEIEPIMQFLGSFASVLPFPSGILTIHSIPLHPTSANCSRDAGCRTEEATARPLLVSDTDALSGDRQK